MTAVEFLAKQALNYLNDEQENHFIKVIQKALEMEEGQHKETFKQSRQAKIFEKDMPPVWESFEQYYNETYKPST
jgi:hypothetical protein